MSGLSVIVLTSPGREGNLRACLSALAGQTRPADELIVVDDGSVGGADVVAAYPLALDYLWRPNDGNISASRNLGAEAASGGGLVFLDGDLVLNPHALAYYRAYLDELSDAAVYGYHGNVCTPDAVYPSAWIPGLAVHAADERFPWQPGIGLTAHPHLFSRPQDFCWGASFAMPRAVFDAAGGFNAECFTRWGFEDLDFGHRLVNLGLGLHFSLDVWAESCQHPRAWSDHDKLGNLGRISPLTRAPQAVHLLHDRGRPTLLQAWEQLWSPAMAPFAQADTSAR